LGRFTQPDTVLPEPGDPQQLNRFAYARNNPLKYTDPSGHDLEQAYFDKTGRLPKVLPPFTIGELRSMDRQAAIDIVTNYLEVELGVHPAPGVVARYGGPGPVDWSGETIADNPLTDPDDPFINIYEGTFSLESSADVVGTFGHEFFHSQQEAQIEAMNGENIWARTSVTQRTAIIYAIEVEAHDFTQALPLRYSTEYMENLQNYREGYQRGLEIYGEPFAPGSYYLPTPLDEHF
jgi:hypothetical protein